MMLFGTAKRLSGFDGKELNLSVDGSRIDTTTIYKYLGVYLDPTLNLDMHFYKTYKKAAGRVNLFQRIRSNTDTLSAERIYRAMIMPIFYLLRSNYAWLVRDTKVPNKKPGTTKPQDYSAKLKMFKL